jgi:hypothetical protein
MLLYGRETKAEIDSEYPAMMVGQKARETTGSQL